MKRQKHFYGERWWTPSMRTLARFWLVVFAFTLGKPVHAQSKTCSRAVLDGEVTAGQSFERVFVPGLRFLLEPIASGWIVRVLPVDGKRGPHDYAELATPPYASVTPLAIGTDFSFRSQDAVAWNPRHFRYAATPADFRNLLSLYQPSVTGDL